MKTFSIVAATALLLMSTTSFAQSISVTADTLDEAESQIAAKAAELGGEYIITEASTNNRVHMTAEVYK
ncbi:YdgH/BhsA/McbA-like domain containing protein [Klebsiella quasipneumoniae]|uniref:YdgH/BhsA/McbA-like domain containing protein n=1 Tax=Klebsiella pneumoniae TaxID=573 RepID=UPI0036D62EB5